MKILVAYDGTLHSKDALRKGIGKAKEQRGELLVLHVVNNNMLIDYDLAPGEAEFIKRERAGYLEEAKVILNEEGQGLRTGIFSGEGDPEEQITQFAAAKKVDLLLCPAAFKSVIRRYDNVLGGHGKESEDSTVIIGTSGLTAEADIKFV